MTDQTPERVKPYESPFRDADARYRSTIHTEPTRTIRIDAEGLDAGIYVELLRMITDRWPRAKLAGGGIVVPDTEASTAPERGDWTTVSYWSADERRATVDALHRASGRTPGKVVQELARHGQHSANPAETVATFVNAEGMTSV